MDGSDHRSTTGHITVHLVATIMAQTGELAASNARRDVEGSDILKSVDAAQSAPMQAVGAVANIDLNSNNFLKSLKSILSKLDVFVQIVDKTSKVSFFQAVRMQELVMIVRWQIHPFASFAWQVTCSLYNVCVIYHPTLCALSHCLTRPSRGSWTGINNSLCC